MSGTVLFVANVASLLTGFIFTFLVARNLTPHDLGTWFFIGSVISYFQVMDKVIPYWAGRDIPRGRDVGRTALLFNLLASLPFFTVFIILSSVFAGTVSAEQRVFLIAAVFIPIYYTSAALETIIYSTSPHRLGPRTLIIDGVKIALSLLMLGYGLPGVITAVILANVVYIIYLYNFARQASRAGFDSAWLKDSLKRGWLPLHESVLGYVSRAADTFIIGVLLTTVDLSYYGIALTISSVLKTATYLTAPVYPKLLKSDSVGESELKALFKFQHIFVVPMVAGGISLAPQLVEIFGTRYLQAAAILPILLAASSIGTVNYVMKTVATGLEAADKQPSGIGLLKSSLFMTQLPNYLYVATLVGGTLATAEQYGIVGAAAARLTAAVLGIIPVCVIYSKKAPLTAALHGLHKVTPASVVMAMTLFLLSPRGSLQTLASIGLGAALYFAVLLLIDSDSRRLARKAVEEAKKLIIAQSE